MLDDASLPLKPWNPSSMSDCGLVLTPAFDQFAPQLLRSLDTRIRIPSMRTWSLSFLAGRQRRAVTAPVEIDDRQVSFSVALAPGCGRRSLPSPYQRSPLRLLPARSGR